MFALLSCFLWLSSLLFHVFVSLVCTPMSRLQHRTAFFCIYTFPVNCCCDRLWWWYGGFEGKGGAMGRPVRVLFLIEIVLLLFWFCSFGRSFFLCAFHFGSPLLCFPVQPRY